MKQNPFFQQKNLNFRTPAQTSLQYSAGQGGGRERGRDPNFEPPAIARRNPFPFGVNHWDVDQALEMLDPRSFSWLFNMMGGPTSFHNNPWGNFGGPLSPGWANPPITGDVNTQGGSRHMGVRKNT